MASKPHVFDPHLPDDVSVRHWLAGFVAYLAILAVPLALLAAREGWAWADWLARPAETFAQTSLAVKLLSFTLYLSLCCTFLPLPTGWVVAGVATREAAVAAGLAEGPVAVAMLTAGIVGLCGAVGSTAANLNDYHLFTWLLRHDRVAAVRRTRGYQAAAAWFARAPFFWLVVFNVAPVPVDAVRMLATSRRYPRVPFAAANFVGRFIRYGVIAFATYWWDLGWAAPVALLALAAVLGGARLGPRLARRLFSIGRANQPVAKVSEMAESEIKI